MGDEPWLQRCIGGGGGVEKQEALEAEQLPGAAGGKDAGAGDDKQLLASHATTRALVERLEGQLSLN
eukprot:COSAG06_NODE_36380_length_447_cov_8.261494_1_plen_66_part_01